MEGDPAALIEHLLEEQRKLTATLTALLPLARKCNEVTIVDSDSDNEKQTNAATTDHAVLDTPLEEEMLPTSPVPLPTSPVPTSPAHDDLGSPATLRFNVQRVQNQ